MQKSQEAFKASKEKIWTEYNGMASHCYDNHRDMEKCQKSSNVSKFLVSFVESQNGMSLYQAPSTKPRICCNIM